MNCTLKNIIFLTKNILFILYMVHLFAVHFALLGYHFDLRIPDITVLFEINFNTINIKTPQNLDTNLGNFGFLSI